MTCPHCHDEGDLLAFLEVRKVDTGWAVHSYLVGRSSTPEAIVTTPDDSPYVAIQDAAWELVQDLIRERA